nr:hypothetical protein [Tanacetum cinerariifolium]
MLHIMLVQVYVDDIISGSTKKSWCDEFEDLMKNRFQISSMGELTFFHGLQFKQKEDGIFISQDKYVAEILKKFDFLSVKTASTPIETQKPLVKDEEATDVDVTPKTSHLHAAKKIFRYLKGQPKLGLWYPKVSSFDLEAYLDSDYAGANLDRKSTTREAEYVAGAHCYGHVLWIQNQLLDYRDAYEKKLIQVLKIHTDDNVADLLTKAFDIKKVSDVVKLRALINGKRVVVSEDVIRHDLRLDDVDGVECLPNEEIFTELTRMGYEKPPPKLMFYKAFFFAQWKFLIHTLVQCVSANRTTWNEFSCSMASAFICLATCRKFNFSKYIYDIMVRNVDNPSKFLMYPRFLQVIINAQVDDLSSHTNQYTSHALTQKVFANMRRVGGKIVEIDANEDITLVDDETQVDLGVGLQGRTDDVSVAKEVSDVEPTMFDDEEVTLTMAQTLIKMKAKKERLLYEQMAKSLHDEEVEQAAAREKQEKDDLEKAKVKYQSLKREPISVAQARKNMIIYLKNMVGYKMAHFRGMTYDKESFKKLKAVEVSGSHFTQDTPTDDPKEISEEEVKKMLEIVPGFEFKVAFCLKTVVFCLKTVAFCLKTVAFCLKTRCVLSQDSLRLSKDSLRFVSKPIVFCVKLHCFSPQNSLRFASGTIAFCPLRFVYRSSLRFSIPQNRPPMLKKDNYVPWSSRIIRYARSRPNGKMIVDSIENGPYVSRMIATPGEPDLLVPVPESLHEQTDEELTETDIKRMDADDQAIQTILLGLPEDIYVVVDSCETAKEIWERVRQMRKVSDIGEQEKNAKLFNEWEKFTSTDGESIKLYYHRHVTTVRQIKNLHEADFTQIYNFLKINQEENGLVIVPGIANQNGTGNVVAAKAEGTGNGNQARCYNCRELGYIARNYTARPRRRDAAYLQTQLLIAQKEKARIQLQVEEFDIIAAAGDLDEIKEVNANCILMANLQQASTSSTQHDRAPVHDTDGSAEQCLVTANHDACLTPSVSVLNSRANKLYANVSRSANQKRHRTQVWKPKQVGSKERLTPKPRLPRFSLKWSPSGRSFDLKGKLVAFKETNCPSHDKASNIKLLINFMWKFLGTVRFGNDHIAAILGYGDLKWGNVTITRVYFVEGLGHNLFSVGQFCDADLEVTFRRNTCFISDLDGVDLLKGNLSTNLYTINLHEMTSASPICLMARATPTKSYLWHQRLSHLNFDTINDWAKNDLVSSLPKFKYAKEHLCPSCKQGKSKRALHPSKPVLNFYFLRTKDETPEVIKNFLKKIYVRLQA